MKQTTSLFLTNHSCLVVLLYALILPGMVRAAEHIKYLDSRSYPISVEPFFTAGVALGDIDGDGDVGMVEANGRHWPQANYVYFNAENRGLTKRVQPGEYERTAYTVKLADMDGDGDLINRKDQHEK